jgi:galactose oxidase-like protein
MSSRPSCAALVLAALCCCGRSVSSPAQQVDKPGSDAGVTPVPATGSFQPTGRPQAPITSPTATLLPDGRVLVVSGFPGYPSSADVELYDPAAGTFSSVEPTPVGDSHAGARLLDGSALVSGGGVSPGGIQAKAAAALWNGSALVLTGDMTAARANHSATLLSDGRILVAGGRQGLGAFRFLASAELYRPDSGTFSATGSLQEARESHTATLLQDGRVLIAGGSTFYPYFEKLAGAELYDPATGTFSSGGSMTVPRAGHSATTLPDGRVLIAGGDEQGTAEVYTPAGGFIGVGPMLARRARHTATLLENGRVLLVEGSTSLSAEVFDPSSNSFLPAANPLDLHQLPAAVRLLDGSVLIVGGNTAELFRP